MKGDARLRLPFPHGGPDDSSVFFGEVTRRVVGIIHHLLKTIVDGCLEFKVVSSMTLAANVIPLQIITELVHALLCALLQGCQRMLGDSSGRGGGCTG